VAQALVLPAEPAGDQRGLAQVAPDLVGLRGQRELGDHHSPDPTLAPMLTDVPSTLTHLEGSASGETYDADRLIGLDPVDGRPLLARYDLERAAATLTRESLAGRRAGGLWRWAELLPVRAPEHRIHLGEGATPLLRAPRLAPAAYRRLRGRRRRRRQP